MSILSNLNSAYGIKETTSSPISSPIGRSSKSSLLANLEKQYQPQPGSTPINIPISGLAGPTTLSKTPETKWPLGFVGEMAKAAYDTTKKSIEGFVSSSLKVVDTFLPPAKAPGFSMYNNEKLPAGVSGPTRTEINPTFKEDLKANLDYQKNNQSTPLERATSLGELAISASMLYPPIAEFNAGLAAAKKLPGVASVPAKLVDYGFVKLSELGTTGINLGLDEAKNKGIISQKTYDTITPLSQQIASLATLIVGSKIGFKLMEKGLGGMKTNLTVKNEFKGADGTDYITTKEIGIIPKSEFIKITGQSGVYKNLPFSEANKGKINQGFKLGVGFSINPFSTAYGLVSSRITTKIHERQQAGIEITPEESKKIVEEVKQELPDIIGKSKTEITNQAVAKSNMIANLEKAYGISKESSIKSPSSDVLAEKAKQAGEGKKVTLQENQSIKAGIVENIPKTETFFDTVKKQQEISTRRNYKNDTETMGKKLKGDAMEMSAIKRKMEGNPTPTEIQNAKNYLESNYRNKEVTVDGIKGKVGKTSFGKTEVIFKNGTSRFYPREKVVSEKVTPGKIIEHLKTEGKNQLQGKANVHGIKETKPIESVKNNTTSEIKPTEKTKPVIINEETKKLQSRVFQRLKEERQQEMGFTPEGMSKDVLYNEIDLKKDAEKATELLKTDKEKAYRVAMGAEELPDVTSTAVNIAMAEKALSDGNNSLYSRLVKNRSLAQTRRGQEIVSEKGSVTDNSTAKYVKELISSRLETLGKRYLDNIKLKGKGTPKEKAIKTIDKEVEKVKEKIQNKEMDIKEAQSLIDKLACI